jgi:ADP-ribose pyrophosphatase YjhB (NUDIX family)
MVRLISNSSDGYKLTLKRTNGYNGWSLPGGRVDLGEAINYGELV